MKIYHVKKTESLKENLWQVLPEMFDDFFEHKETVVSFPIRRNKLHEMRKSGKPFRYAMELGEYCFGDEFKNCLEEVKVSLELMGEIHDADVMIPDINQHMKEIRFFNQTITDSTNRISTKMLRESVISLRDSRRAMFAELSAKLNAWESEDFRSRLVKAMVIDN